MKINLPTLKKTFIAIGTFILLTYHAFGQHFDYHSEFKVILEKSKDKKSEYYYPKLLERFQSNDSTLTDREVIALQIGVTNLKDYKPYETMTQEREILELVSDKSYEKAIKKCDELLKDNPLNFVALMEKSFCFMKLNKTDALLQKEKFMRVVSSILWSGDGTIEHPIFVLGPADGQFLIRYVLGQDIGLMGSGRDKNGYFLDILEMTDGVQSKDMHFIIPHATNTMFKK